MSRTPFFPAVAAALSILSLAASPRSSGRLTQPFSLSFQEYWCGACHNCIYPGYFQHEFFAWGPLFPDKQGGYHGCFLGPCAHGPCQAVQRSDSAGVILVGAGSAPTQDLAEEFRVLGEALEAGRPGAVEAVVRLMAAHPDRLTVNRSRRALQLIAECGLGVIAGHLPLQSTTFETLKLAVAGSLADGL